MTDPNSPRTGRRTMADPRHGHSPGIVETLAIGLVLLGLTVAGFVYVVHLIGA